MSVISKPISLKQVNELLGNTNSNIGWFRGLGFDSNGSIAVIPANTQFGFSAFENCKKCQIGTDNLFFHIDTANSSCYNGTTTLTDLSGQNNNATLAGTTLPQVINGNVVLVNTQSNYIATTFKPNLDNNRQHTFELWFYASAPTPAMDNTALISNFGSNWILPFCGLHIRDNGVIHSIERNNANVRVDYVGNKNIADGKWHHVLKVSTASSNITYLDGAQIDTRSRPGGVITSGQNIVIGGNTLNRYQNCRIGPVRIYLDRALSNNDVLKNYYSELPRYK